MSAPLPLSPPLLVEMKFQFMECRKVAGETVKLDLRAMAYSITSCSLTLGGKRQFAYVLCSFLMLVIPRRVPPRSYCSRGLLALGEAFPCQSAGR
jgi:hypothetical protein